MSLFKKDKKVQPLTFEEERWLRTDRRLKELAEEREMFRDDETFQDFLDWRFHIQKDNWGYKPDVCEKLHESESEAWVFDYYAEHPDKTPPWRDK